MLLSCNFFGALAALLVALTQAGSDPYESYLRSLEKRHEMFHEASRAEAPLFSNSLQEKLATQHGIRDGQPAAAFPETYWRELVTQIAELGSTNPEQDAQELLVQAEAEEEAKEAAANEPDQINFVNGEHKVSGGAGEGTQKLGPLGQFTNAQESKNDQLPSYCHPPNPCPVGYDSDTFSSPCEHGVVDSIRFNKHYIWNKMSTGACTCDTEHMTSCPTPAAAEADARDEEQAERSGGLMGGNPFLSGEKRKLVAKKVPQEARHSGGGGIVKRTAMFQSQVKSVANPWLGGEVLKSVQKKAGPSAKHNLGLDM